MTDMDHGMMVASIELLEKKCADLKARIEALEAAVAGREAVDARRSSIEVGTPAKGGAIKVYLDPYGDPKANEDAINEAKRLLALAGGQPLPPTEVR